MPLSGSFPNQSSTSKANGYPIQAPERGPMAEVAAHLAPAYALLHIGVPMAAGSKAVLIGEPLLADELGE